MSYQVMETKTNYKDFIAGGKSVIIFVKNYNVGCFLALKLAESIDDNSVSVGVVDRSEGCFKKDYEGEPSDRHVFKVYYSNGERLDYFPGDHANYSYYSRKPVLREEKRKIKKFNEDEDYYKYDLSFKDDEDAEEDEQTKKVEYIKEDGWQVYHTDDVNNGDDEYDEYYMDDVAYIKENVTSHDKVWSSPNEYIVDYNSDPWYGSFVNNYLHVHLHKDDASDEDEPSNYDGPHDEDILMESSMGMGYDF